MFSVHAAPVAVVIGAGPAHGRLNQRGGALPGLLDSEVFVVQRQAPLDPTVGPLSAVDHDNAVTVSVVAFNNASRTGEVAAAVGVPGQGVHGAVRKSDLREQHKES